jgi:hypothetical protein
MVQAQKRINTNPSYGLLPAGDDESRAAAEALRELARKKRRRTKALRWGVATALVGGLGVAGWFAYPEYQKDQARRAAEFEAAADREPTEILDTIDELSLADRGPDTAQLVLLDELLPDEARPFTTATDVGAVVMPRSPDSETTFEVQAYLLDVDAYRASRPESYSAWLTTQTAHRADNPSLTFAEGEPELGERALIAYALDADGSLQLGLMIDPVNDIRAEYTSAG